jgi:hypothetical protein
MKTLTLKEKKKFWNKIVKKSIPKESRNNRFAKAIQTFVFNTIVNAPIMPDIKSLNEDK